MPQRTKWLCHPCRLGGLNRFRAGGGNQNWPTCEQSGYVTPPVSGIPTASERGGKLQVAQTWAKWLRHPCRLGDPHRCTGWDKIRSGPLVVKVATSPLPSRGSPAVEIRSGPLVGKVATSPLPSRRSPPLHSGGGNQKWPTSGQSGYVTDAVSGIPAASWRGAKSEVAHRVGKVAASPLPSRVSPLLHSGGGNQKWPTCGQSGYVTPAVSRIPTPSQRGMRAGIRSGPLVGKVAMSALPSRGSPRLHGGGQNQKWPTCGQSGYATPSVSGIPTASERGGGQNQKWPTCGQSGYATPAASGIPTASERADLEVAYLWAKWLRHACRLRDSHHFMAGGKIRSGPQVGKVATLPLPSRGSPPLHSGEGGGGIRSGPLVAKVATSPLPSRALERGENRKWPTFGQSGYATPAVSGIPTALMRGAKAEMAHKWAKWLRHPCCLRGPRRYRGGGGEIRSAPQKGKVATSPLPSRGSRPL